MGNQKGTPKRRERKVVCPDCDVLMRLKGQTKPYYMCPECKARLISGPYGKPRGVPADKRTRKMRGIAHAVFERFSREKQCSRAESIRWLSQRLGIKATACHFGQMEADDLQRVIDICDQAHAGKIPGPGGR